MKNLFLHVVLAHFAFAAFADPSPDIQNNKKEAGQYQIEDSPPLKEKSDISSLISAISNYFYPKKEDSGPSSVKEKPTLSSDKARSPASAGIRYSKPRSFAPASAPQVVFFQKHNGHLVSKCQVSVKRYPKILPSQLAKKMADRLALTNRQRMGNNALDLKFCDSNSSLRLSKSTRDFGRTQTAMLPVAAAAVACAMGGFSTYIGVRQLMSKNPNINNRVQGVVFGIAGAGLTATAGGGLANLIFVPSQFKGTYTIATLEKALVRAMAGSAIGALCATAGGVLGYIYER